ncbi:nucleoside triphosphate pyrophosphohydrolase [Candidatus Zixiibacteriota bacterium]
MERRVNHPDTGTCMPTDPKTLPADPLKRLETIMAILRGPDGCPWDREQDHRTLRTYLLEETYEVLDLLDSPGDIDDVEFVEELGDLLLQVVFHAQLASERDAFNLDMIAERISSKLIYRHPHVFASTEVSGTGEVLQNWEKLKQAEGKESALDGVPSNLPALLRAHRIVAKADRSGFRWGSGAEALEKVCEEFGEFEEAVTATLENDSSALESVTSEFGDLIMSLATLLLRFGIDPELAAREATQQFEQRFRSMEERVSKEGLTLTGLDRDDLLERWEQARQPSSSSE